jgi:hypothetical protein
MGIKNGDMKLNVSATTTQKLQITEITSKVVSEVLTKLQKTPALPSQQNRD